MADLNLSGTPEMVHGVDARVHQEELFEELRGVGTSGSGRSFLVMWDDFGNTPFWFGEHKVGAGYGWHVESDRCSRCFV